MKYIASCSFGKDSLAMVLRLIKEKKPLDEVVFFDTGMEFNAIYNNRDKMKDIFFQEGIRYTELSFENNFLYLMLVKPIKYRRQEERDYPFHYGYEWCGGNCRWGTTYKLMAINKHYKSTYGNEQIIEYIGIAADEKSRCSDESRKKYPLIEWNMTEKDCLEYCLDNGFNWLENNVDLYDVLDRVSCWCCRNKNIEELKNIYLYLPEYWQKLRGLQSRIDEPMKGKGKSVFELEERFKLQFKEG